MQKSLRQILLLAFLLFAKSEAQTLDLDSGVDFYKADDDDSDRSASASANAKSYLGNGPSGSSFAQASSQAQAETGGYLQNYPAPGGYGGGASASAEALAQLGLGGGGGLGGDLGASASANALASLGQGGSLGGLGGLGGSASAEASAEALANLGGGLGGLGGGLGGGSSASASAEALANLGLGGLGGNYGGGSSASANAEVLANLGGLSNNYGGGASANAYAQAQAQAQAQALAQAQAQVQAQAQALAQAQAQAQSSARAVAQAQAQAQALAQANAQAQAQSRYAFAQAQANARALAQAKSQSTAVAQAQANAVAQAQAASQAAAQAQAVALAQANALAQAQAHAYAASQLQAQAQAQATASAKALAEAQSRAFATAQVQAQAQAKANNAAQAALRAQAQAVAVSRSQAQAQARANAQAQAAAQAQVRATASSQALAQSSTSVLAQAEASASSLARVLGQQQQQRPQYVPALPGYGGLDLSASANAEVNSGVNSGYQRPAPAYYQDSTRLSGQAAGARSRIVPYKDYIFPNEISGKSLVKCSKAGEFHYLNIQGQCSICACVQNYGVLNPVCVNCNGCTYVDTGPLPSEPLLPDINTDLFTSSLPPPFKFPSLDTLFNKKKPEENPNEFGNKPQIYPLLKPFNEFSFSDSLSGESDLQFPEAIPEGDLHIPHYPYPEPLPQLHEHVETPRHPFPEVAPEIVPFDTPYLHETYTPSFPEIEPIPDITPIDLPSFLEFKPNTDLDYPKIHFNEPFTDIRLIQEPILPQFPNIDYLSNFTHFSQPSLPPPEIDTSLGTIHIPQYLPIESTPHIIPYPDTKLPELPHHLPDLQLPNITINTPLYISKPVKIPKFEIPTIEKIPFPNSVNVPRLPQLDYRPTTEKVSPNVKQPVYFPRPPWPPYPKPDTTDLTKPELVPNPDVKLPAPKPLPYPDTTVLPWPPRELGQPGGTKLGPLPGPPPHHNCRPYPVKQYFQHPWDECQVCVCQEFQAHGIVNVEVNCYTKPSCCIELPDLQPRLPDTSITTPGSVSEQGQLNILDKICEHKSFGEQFVNPNDNCRLCTCQLIGNLVYPVCKRSLDCTTPAKPLPLDSIVYIEPECRYKEPNQEYKNNCKLCTCQPVFIYVVATCKPTGECQLAPVDGENIFTDASAGSLPTSNINTQINPTPYPDNNLPSTEHYNLTLPNGYPMLSNNVGSENGLIFSSQFGSNNGLKGTNNQISNGGILNGYQGFGSSNYNGLTSSNNGLKNNFLSPNQYVPNNDGISSNYGLSNQEILSGYQGLGVLNNNIQNGLTSSNRYLSQNGLISSNNFGSSNYLGSQESLNGYQSLGSSNNGYLNSLTSSNNYGSHSLGSQVNENGYHQLGSFNRYEFLNGLRFHGGYPSVDLHNTHVTAQPFINHIHPISEVSSLNSLDIHGVPHYTSYTVHPEGVHPLALQQSALAKLKAALTSGAITPADRRSLPLTEYSLNSEQSQQPSANIAQRHVIASATSDESRSLESTMILPGNPNTDGGENSDESGDDTHTVGDAVAALINEGKAVTVSDESDSREGANEKHV